MNNKQQILGLIVLAFLLINCSNNNAIISKNQKIDFKSPLFVRMVDANQTGGRSNYAYAYSPTIIREKNRYHAFFCSPGDVSGKSMGEWDFIRYTSSEDAKSWTNPTIALKAQSDQRGLDYSACDPSLVFFQGFYYLFYSGAENIRGPVSTGLNKDEVLQTVVRVARAENIEGPYLKYTRRHTWEINASDPMAIVSPANDVRPLSEQKNLYGAGQQSVVVHNGKLWMWYLDTTAQKNKKNSIYLLSSNNPVKWNAKQGIATDNDTVGLDVKYDSQTGFFISLGLPRQSPDQAESAMVLKLSKDGIHWSQKQTILNITNMAHWVRPEGGISSDPEGILSSGETLFAFPVPHNLGEAQQSDTKHHEVPFWDIYTFSVNDVSKQLLSRIISGQK